MEQDVAAGMAVLEEVALLGPVRREMARSAAPDVAGGAAALWHLAQSGPMRMSELASRLRVDVSVGSRQVAELVAAGQLQRSVDPADRRACVLSVTDAGRAALDAAVERVAADFAPRLTGWSTPDLLRLAADLRRLREDLLDGAPRAAALTPA